MSIPDERTLTREVTTWKARFISAGMVAAGILVVGTMPPSWPPTINSILTALATTSISIGALSLLFSVSLRRNLQQEMARLVVTQRGLAEGQLVSAGRATRVAWNLILSGASDYRLLVAEPAWLEANFHHILEAGKQRLIDVEIFLPDPESSYIPALAEMLDIDPESLSRIIRERVTALEKRWAAQREDGPLKKGSSLKVRYLSKRPLYSIILVDASAVLTLTGSTGREGADSDYTYIYSGDRQGYPLNWFNKQLKRHQQGNIVFANEV